jgi:Dyp-type peroxidase family
MSTSGPLNAAQLQRDVVVKGRGLGSSSDLTLFAAIKSGMVDSLESITYKTRIKRVLDLLHAARTDSHEFHQAQLLSDSIERVGAIQSVRVAVVEPEDKVMLAVTFDGPWEAYIRVLWEKVGPLLDLIFCGTVDYVRAETSTFEQWLDWARRVQVETGFFYGPPAFTARDVLYARRLERTRLRGLRWKDSAGNDEPAELNELRSVLPSAEEAAELVGEGRPSDDPADITADVPRQRVTYERFRGGVKSMAALYRLTDLFRPGTPDGDVLHAAALSLLREFTELYRLGRANAAFDEARNGAHGEPPRFRREMDWLFPPDLQLPVRRPAAAYEGLPPGGKGIEDVQGGILRSYEGITHGVLLLLSFDGPDAAARFLDRVSGQVTTYAHAPGAKGFSNVAFTPAGLRACGLEDSELELFPEEFRQGMADRAGLLGDVRHNHPRRWRLPRRLLKLGEETAFPIQLSAVHAVLQLRCAATAGQEAAVAIEDPAHPFHDEIARWLAADEALRGIHVLAVQTMKRRHDQGRVTEHFGFADGGSDPRFDPNEPERIRMALGEAIVGHNNPADTAPAPEHRTDAQARRLRWLYNGSFLVLRKYRQFPERLDAQVKAAADVLAAKSQPQQGAATVDHAALAETIYGKLVGRNRDGTPLVEANSPGSLNDFDYDGDPQGRRCPLHAHIRLANPRPLPGAMSRPPRIVRRSMPWGSQEPRKNTDCGLMFMAYAANISEQFEVVQRWLTGGNSTGSSSGPTCPIVGVPENGVERHFRFEHEGQAVNVQLEPRTPLFHEPQVVTQLDWGLYLFTPSVTVIKRLHEVARHAAHQAPSAPSVSWSVDQGRTLLAELRRMEHERGATAALQAWKTAIEDLDSIDRQRNAALWAAIRHDHGGVLRTPYGVLVADRELLSRVLHDPDGCYSISGQMQRMKEGIGEIFLGMDDGADYRRQSEHVNAELMRISADEGFRIAYDAATARMDAIRDHAMRGASAGLSPWYEVSFDAREIVDEVLASLCDAWFGLKGSPHFQRGSVDWNWKDTDPAIYPGHFIALSRYMFQPHPGSVPAELAGSYGKALVRSMEAFVADVSAASGSAGSKPARITHAVLTSPCANEPGFAARTMAGVIMGFAPPITGALLNVLREWARTGRFWKLRAEAAPAGDYAQALGWIGSALREGSGMRPMPQVIWRTARKPDRLGRPGPHAVDVAVGDIVVLGLVSGTQQSLEDGRPEDRLMFGGTRTAGGQHPTHACPGYAAGMGALVGTLTAILTRSEELKPGIGPLTFDMRGPTADTGVEALHLASARAAKAAMADAKSAAMTPFAAQLSAPALAFFNAGPSIAAGSKGLLFAWGDSWLDYRPPFIIPDFDIANALVELGYTINAGGDVDKDPFCNYAKWGYLQVMAQSVKNDPKSFIPWLRSNRSRDARAILLSGGGNDSVEGKLRDLLFEKGTSGGKVVNMPAVEAHVKTLRGYYETVIDAIQGVYEEANLTTPPILVHGYANPHPFVLPIGNSAQKSWLQDPFIQRGWTEPGDSKRASLEVGSKAMKEIIGELNRMLDQLARSRKGVRYVDLRPVLPDSWNDWTKPGWQDNMHATPAGFRAIAAKIDEVLATIATLKPATLAAHSAAPLK